MQRMRNLALISGLVAAAVLVGALALATYRREIVAEAEEHAHESGDHHAPAVRESPSAELPARAEEANRPAQAAPEPEQAPPSRAPAEVEPAAEHEHADDAHHH